jgi:hypothetical protein
MSQVPPIPEDLKGDWAEAQMVSGKPWFFMQIQPRKVIGWLERIVKLTADLQHSEEMYIAMRDRCARTEERLEELEAENTRLKAPVGRHNEADGILQRFFITGGRQYRYTKQDGADLEDLLNEWIASRATHTPQEGQ